eukprot:scaffold301_cov243-Pinguiococcus_pyrenoidosus.AAC.44
MGRRGDEALALVDADMQYEIIALPVALYLRSPVEAPAAPSPSSGRPSSSALRPPRRCRSFPWPSSLDAPPNQLGDCGPPPPAATRRSPAASAR